MKIISVNTGIARRIRGTDSVSGIDKRPRNGAIKVTRLGLEGDEIVHREVHGGPDQAVYLYSTEDYAFFEMILGRELLPGSFGENLTVSGFDSRSLSVGDRFISAGLELEVTSPRIPCSTFAAHMDTKDLPARFMAEGRAGAYCRVIREGPVEAGGVFTHRLSSGEAVTLGELMETYPYKRISAETRARYLASPLQERLAQYLRGERDRP
ncbi:MAG: MOSC domain-containing protein [Notoacmeibacter sp.]|nr:MOSC domain-containing protein [Notoacmeibacter sp.]MCC0032432.1 MOSC domain-containing protein [Brucellaceae bacterium]